MNGQQRDHQVSPPAGPSIPGSCAPVGTIRSHAAPELGPDAWFIPTVVVVGSDVCGGGSGQDGRLT